MKTKFKMIVSLIVAASVSILIGCSSADLKEDPVGTGEIIGITYTLTKKELSISDREKIEEAYGIFSRIVTADTSAYEADVDIKGLLMSEVDKQYPGVAYEGKRAAIKILIAKYWHRVDIKFDLDASKFSEQMAIIRQVHEGIELGLGR